jgi:hypothetical protein
MSWPASWLTLSALSRRAIERRAAGDAYFVGPAAADPTTEADRINKTAAIKVHAADITAATAPK